MKILLTGYTGFLGNNIAIQLLKSGYQVKAMFRGALPENESGEIEFVKGDLSDVHSLGKAVNNCDAVIHSAGLVKMWDNNPGRFMEVNYMGTKNLLNACKLVGVNRFINISSAGVIGPTTEIPAKENYKPVVNLYCDYVTSKQRADNEVLLAGQQGMQINIVYPSRMYGSGPLNHANSITVMINDFRKGNWYFRPPYGNVTGSYNHVEEVATGVVNVLRKGVPGEKYLLAGENMSYDKFFDTLRIVSGKRNLLLPTSYPLLYLFSLIQEKYGKVNTNYEPKVNSIQIKRFRYHYAFDSSKAIRELNYKVVPFDYGLHKTIQWLQKNQH